MSEKTGQRSKTGPGALAGSGTPGVEPYILTRALFLQSLGLVYFAAYLSLFLQAQPLFSSRGILPIERYLTAISSRGAGFLDLPSIFWFVNPDQALPVVSIAGMLTGILAALGFGNGILFFAAWALYVSIVNAGQIFYGYGWETLLCEAGFLAIFFAPPITPCRFSNEVPRQFIWLLRWLIFRMMFGAGMIKIRGDLCWRDLTCLIYHFETQPIPNPLSWYFHHLPAAVLKFGVAVNHAVELVLPWLLFTRRSGRLLAAWSIIGFQLVLILSGNLSWLNWLTIVIAFGALDDRCLRAIYRTASAPATPVKSPESGAPQIVWSGIRWCVFATVVFLSINPAVNMFSSRQLMNASFDPLHLVNTYGAFGSVGKERMEVVIEGTDSAVSSGDEIIGSGATPVQWREYEFKCKPGDPLRTPCVISPLQLRLDWQIWFAALSRFEYQGWLHLVLIKLFQGDRGVITLFDSNPFPQHPPRYLRGLYYHYTFTNPGEPGWWKRELIGIYFAPVKNPYLD